MKAYLVGGAIRNRLLGRRVRERDYVVVGATPELMEQQGFRSVGKDFPVFLHPQTNEEYALARTERKSGKGYKGFVFHASPDVTLEEDLLRRDFTVNAMAEDEQSGDVADPFHGRNDCASRILRHVSEAFVEDPLRVLRAARFVADLHLNLAPETEELIRKIVASGEIEYLSAERICTEIIAGLNCERPTYYINLLHDWGVFKSILPEADELLSLEQNETLNIAAANFWGTEVKLAALLHDERIPHDQDFAQESADQIKQACERLRLPKRMHEQVAGACAEHGKVHVFEELSDEQVLALFARLGAFRRRDILESALALAGCDYACQPQACMYAPHPMCKQILRVLEAACAIDGKQAAASSPRPEDGVRAARLQAIAQARAGN